MDLSPVAMMPVGSVQGLEQNAPIVHAGQTGILCIPAGHVLSGKDLEQALHRVRTSSYTWMVLGGERSSLEPLFATGKAGRLDPKELLEGTDLINETARLWARSWCQIASTKDMFGVAGCNIGASLYRELVYCFLAVLKQAYFLTRRLASGTLAQCVVMGPQGWEEIAPEKLFHIAAEWIGHTTGVRRMVIEEDKKGWRQDLKRRMLWLRNVLESFSSKPSAQGKILVSSDPAVVSSVMKALARLGHGQMVLRPLLGWKPFLELRRNGVTCRVYRDYLTPEVRARAEEQGRRIFAAKGAWEESVRQARTFSWRGMDWWEAVRPQFDYYFSEYFSTLAGYALLAQELFAKENIRGILVDEDVCEFNRTLVTVAGTLGIPSVVVQHGAPYDLQPTGFAPVSATRIAAWGRYSEDLFRNWGVEPEKIVLTGVPRYDGFGSDDKKRACAEITQAVGWNGTDRLIVYACDPYHREGREDYVGIPSSQREEREHFECFLAGLAEIPEAFGIVKLHPKDNGEAWWRNIVQAHPVQARTAVTRLTSTRNLLRACDILVTTYSTVAIEAMLLGKPMITVNLTGRKDLQPHAELGASLPVRNPAEMRQAMRRILTDPDTAKMLERGSQHALSYYMEYRDGKSSTRVAELLHGLMEKNNG